MDSAFVGESFELRFRLTDSRDPERKPDTAQYVVRLNGAVSKSGTMTINGNVASFRFEAKAEGMHEIEVSWTMGLDKWRAKHLLNVRA